MAILIGIWFIYLFMFTAKRHYIYKNTGFLLDGEIVGYERGYRSRRCIVSFRHKKENMQMTALQVTNFIYPKKGSKISIYYSERFHDHVLIANKSEIISQFILLFFGLAFSVLGILGVLGYVPVK